MFNTFGEKLAYTVGYIKGYRDGQALSPHQTFALEATLNALPFKSQILKNQIKRDLRNGRYTQAVNRLQFAVA